MPIPSFIGNAVVAQLVTGFDGANLNTLQAWGMASTPLVYSAPGKVITTLSPNLGAGSPEARQLSIDVQLPNGTIVPFSSTHVQGPGTYDDTILFYDAAGVAADPPAGSRIVFTWTRSELPQG